MDRKKKVLRWLSDNAVLPSETLPRQFILELLGHERVLIEDHQGVLEYGTEKIRVKTAFGFVSICGKGLHLSCLSKERLVIQGPVAHIEVTRRGC